MWVSVHVSLAGGAMVEAGWVASETVSVWQQTEAAIAEEAQG